MLRGFLRMLQCLHQLTKTFLTDGVFHTAGVFLRSIRSNTRFNQPLRKEAVLCVNLLRRFLADLGQVQVAVRFILCFLLRNI